METDKVALIDELIDHLNEIKGNSLKGLMDEGKEPALGAEVGIQEELPIEEVVEAEVKPEDGADEMTDDELEELMLRHKGGKNAKV